MRKLWMNAMLVFVIVLNAAYLKNAVDILDLPQQFADKFGVTLQAGRMILSSIVLLACVLPIAVYSEGNIILSTAVVVVVMGALISVGWMDYWYLLVVCLIVASLWTAKVVSWIGGKGGED